MGDLNSDLLFRGKANEQAYYGRRLLKILNPFRMKNIIKTATRITEDTATTIDLIIASDTSKILNSGTLNWQFQIISLYLLLSNSEDITPVQYSKKFATTKIWIELNFKGHLNEFPGGQRTFSMKWMMSHNVFKRFITT